MNKVELTSSLWLYAIHGGDPRIIHILEENKIVPPKSSFLLCLKESIKCHQNDIANYIYNNLMEESDWQNNIEQKFKENMDVYGIHYRNYEFFQLA
ncbi:hypothetical protein M9Y10_026399 [Tritrichomonas musculus]|uniref:Uncharacterized protein n=1 Tax=Tritrichomonas musculus TaxID=1915356 RepID=A0ABR2H7H4_9EUKA